MYGVRNHDISSLLASRPKSFDVFDLAVRLACFVLIGGSLAGTTSGFSASTCSRASRSSSTSSSAVGLRLPVRVPGTYPLPDLWGSSDVLLPRARLLLVDSIDHCLLRRVLDHGTLLLCLRVRTSRLLSGSSSLCPQLSKVASGSAKSRHSLSTSSCSR